MCDAPGSALQPPQPPLEPRTPPAGVRSAAGVGHVGSPQHPHRPLSGPGRRLNLKLSAEASQNAQKWMYFPLLCENSEAELHITSAIYWRSARLAGSQPGCGRSASSHAAPHTARPRRTASALQVALSLLSLKASYRWGSTNLPLNSTLCCWKHSQEGQTSLRFAKTLAIDKARSSRSFTAEVCANKRAFTALVVHPFVPKDHFFLQSSWLPAARLPSSDCMAGQAPGAVPVFSWTLHPCCEFPRPREPWAAVAFLLRKQTPLYLPPALRDSACPVPDAILLTPWGYWKESPTQTEWPELVALTLGNSVICAERSS